MEGRQNNRMSIKAVSVRHCAATTAPRSCCPNCYEEQSHNVSWRRSYSRGASSVSRDVGREGKVKGEGGGGGVRS